MNWYLKITSLFLSDFPEGWNILANAFRSWPLLSAICNSFQRVGNNKHLYKLHVHKAIRLTFFFAAASSRLIPPKGCQNKSIRFSVATKRWIANEEERDKPSVGSNSNACLKLSTAASMSLSAMCACKSHLFKRSQLHRYQQVTTLWYYGCWML